MRSFRKKPKTSPEPSRVPPKKYLGQNFLINPHILNKIIASCDLKPTDAVLEIGAGQGVLTKALSPLVKHVTAVETDQRLAQDLKQQFQGSNVTIVHGDILQFPFESLPSPLKVIGNLPYNIATPIIEKVILNRTRCPNFYLTVQLEHGLRIVARPHSKDYGSFSCFVQYYADAKKLFNIKNTCFYPAPKVQSCFVKLAFTQEPKWRAFHEEDLFKLIRQAFRYRRKTIINSLAKEMEKEKLMKIFQELHFDGQWRAEDLTLSQYVLLANRLNP